MKQALTFGGIAGVIIAAYSLTIFFTIGDFANMSLERLALVEKLGYVRYLILLAVVVFAIRVYKKGSETPPSYWSLVKQGVFTALVVAICVAIMEAAYMMLNPEFMDQYGQLRLDKLIAENASAEEIAAFKAEMEQYEFMANPLAMGVFYFFETAILGSVVSLIASIFFRGSKQSAQLAAA